MTTYTILKCADGHVSNPVREVGSVEDVEAFLSRRLGRPIFFDAPDGYSPTGPDETDEPFWNVSEMSPIFYTVETAA